ncbi:E3 ubiquitin-protein ligase RING2-like [Paramacrobiotus metropolitanus]|uniref:E3 ubiquitin-protein ligase RING2-like n=1 Tax=Paramacrobiotus metropolitanus TaxID=2943436 RepID=UPI002445B184|nr:E3 ubiquitin-protein ligase RING2-like [Paramacrobiotus metropolitanus]
METERRQWELTPYEKVRQPQPVPQGNREITTTQRFLETELSCAICLDILRNTRTTKECLHRFCDECISQALRSGNKECPNCRKKLVSMRSLRPDPLFDEIIRTLIPNRAELDRQQSQLLAKLDNKALLSSMEEGMRHQAEQRGAKGTRAPRRISKESSQEMMGESMASASTSEAGSVRGGFYDRNSSERGESALGDDMLNGAPSKKRKKSKKTEERMASMKIVPFEPSKHRQLVDKWGVRFVNVKACATVAHVCQYIVVRLIAEQKHSSDLTRLSSISDKLVRMYMRVGNKRYEPLDHSWRLSDIQERYGVSQMKLAFAMNGSKSKR